MAPGMGIKAPVPRTRTGEKRPILPRSSGHTASGLTFSGCLTCRKRKVKCDELKPICGRCSRLQRECKWSDDLQVIPHRRQPPGSSALSTAESINSGQNFVVEFPGVPRSDVFYIHHFITFCSRFLAYSNDNEGNPFSVDLVPKAASSPALLHSMAALAAGHLSRTQKQHDIIAANHYTVALRELNASLSDPVVARADSTLGACLLLCVYEISHSDNSLWLEHLQGARDLILFRGGPSTTDYLTRFFSFLDISGSLSSGGGPLLEGSYWLEPGLMEDPDADRITQGARWPYYDSDHTLVHYFHELMVFMAKLSRLSAESMSDIGNQHPEVITEKANQIHSELFAWWQRCPEKLRNQRNDWRRQLRPRKLTVPETLEEESFSSCRSCVQACFIYLHHILDPMGRKPQSQSCIDAISDILAIAQETPEGYGLEMGQYWGLFMAGIAVFNDEVAEDLIRRKLKADTNISIYHADRPLDLLEILWKRQHQYGTKYDWRQVQIQMGIQIFILA
ncbi:hypothetical protein EG329_009763 [Mollisiaceae sp. DMI_Dod_QoI]|nr:hypothetical protein EG329_009763 [Helotiales sp. DMI_Dod_QoI]